MAFENVFDSSLIDYSKDFENQDKLLQIRNSIHNLVFSKTADSKWYEERGGHPHYILLDIHETPNVKYGETTKIFEKTVAPLGTDDILVSIKITKTKDKNLRTRTNYIIGAYTPTKCFVNNIWDYEFDMKYKIKLNHTSKETLSNVEDDLVNKYLEAEKYLNKVNESFENVFDSSLVDYSSDFEKQDKLQSFINLLNDKLYIKKDSLDFWFDNYYCLGSLYSFDAYGQYRDGEVPRKSWTQSIKWNKDYKIQFGTRTMPFAAYPYLFFYNIIKLDPITKTQRKIRGAEYMFSGSKIKNGNHYDKGIISCGDFGKSEITCKEWLDLMRKFIINDFNKYIY